MKVIFMGTPDFAVPSLDALCKNSFEIACVVTQPDRAKGRGHSITISPVKAYALEAGLQIFQPERIKDDENIKYMASLNPDAIVTAAFGQILPQNLLDVPKYGVINVHASLLPKYRGAAPVQWAIANGEKKLGVTTMLTDVGIDTGDILISKSLDVGDKTADEMLNELSHLGAALLIETLNGLEQGTLTPIKQDSTQASYYPILRREDALIDWGKPAAEIECFVRAMFSKPTAFTYFNNEAVKIHRIKITKNTSDLPSGSIVWADSKNGLGVVCGDGICVSVERMVFPSSKPMSACEYLRGKSIPVGSKFTGVINENQ